MKTIKESLLSLANIAKSIGLSEDDCIKAIEFLNHKEYGLCFEVIITQMYEYDIEINNEFYDLIVNIADMLDVKVENYSFMKELINEKNVIPKQVKDDLEKISKHIEGHK